MELQASSTVLTCDCCRDVGCHFPVNVDGEARARGYVGSCNYVPTVYICNQAWRSMSLAMVNYSVIIRYRFLDFLIGYHVARDL